jgi:hypothetical protein
MRNFLAGVRIPFYEEVTSEALASWCATMSKLGRLRPPKMDACHPSWRTNWRAPTEIDFSPSGY